MTAPVIVFFNTFFVVLMVLLGLIVLLVLWWCMYGMCQRRSNASTQEILPMTEMKFTRESNPVVNQTVPDVVITDMAEGEALTTETVRPKSSLKRHSGAKPSIERWVLPENR